MSKRIAIVLGASGLIGSELLLLLLADDYFDTVRILVRKTSGFPAHSKLEIHPVDFNNPATYNIAYHEVTAVFCCIGTTMKNVKGDKALYHSIDYDIPVNAAGIAYKNGCSKFLLVSAVGANAKSSNFYLQLKGKVEEAIQKIAIPQTHVLQPSLLLGNRKEKRVAEKLFQLLMKPLSVLLVGSLQQYKPIEATTIASAMLHLSKKEQEGFFIYPYKAIKALLAK